MMRLATLLLVVTVLACGGTATAVPMHIPETPTAASPSAEGPPAVDSSPAANSGAARAIEATPTTGPVPPAILQASPAPDHIKTTAPIRTVEITSGLVVSVGGAGFGVELAITPDEQIQGLSDRPTLAPGSGMLFVYERQSRYSFWMKNMHFPLDIVWIGIRCTVVDVTLNAPPPEPGQTLDQLPLYSPVLPARYVLEINAGEADANGIRAGAPVKFAGDLAGRYGC